MKATEDDGFEEEDKRVKGIEGEREGRIINNGECVIIDVEESEEGSRKIKVCRICQQRAFFKGDGTNLTWL